MAAYLEEYLEFLPEAEASAATGSVYSDQGRGLTEEQAQSLSSLLSVIWKEGNRHALALAAAGLMVKEGYSEGEARRVVAIVCSKSGDGELKDRMMSVQTTYRAARLGRPIRAWAEVKEHLGEDSLNYLQTILQGGDRAPPPEGEDPYRLPFRLTEWRDFPSFPMLIKGLMPSDPRGSVCYLCGLSQSFKSYLALDWGCHISQGLGWQGHATTKAQVLYVAAEGGYRDIVSRLRAWETHYGVRAENLYCRLSPINILDPGSTQRSIDMFAKVEGFKPRLVILDTLSQCAGSADENSSKDARAIYANAKKFGEAFGSTVMLVAHRGKSDSNIMRGSSAFFDDSDATYQMVRPGWQSGGMDCTLNVTKVKSGRLILGHEMNARVVDWQDGGRRGSDLVLVQRVLRSAFENAPKLF